MKLFNIQEKLLLALKRGWPWSSTRPVLCSLESGVGLGLVELYSEAYFDCVLICLTRSNFIKLWVVLCGLISPYSKLYSVCFFKYIWVILCLFFFKNTLSYLMSVFFFLLNGELSNVRLLLNGKLHNWFFFFKYWIESYLMSVFFFN